MRTALFGAVALAALAGVASAQPIITLFGQEYQVTRLNYSESVQLPNIPFPNDPPVPFIESEGLIWAGNNKLLMSADDIDDIGFGMPPNWIIEIELEEVNGAIVGIAGYRTILAQSIVAVGYDMNPTGITINTGAGHAGGGNIVALNGDGLLYGFSYQPGTEGDQLEFPVGSGCLVTPATCAMNISAQNTNAEDITYVPVRGGEFFVTNQDTISIERYSAISGAFLGSAQVGPFGSVAKGLAYTPDSDRLPASVRRPEGLVLVIFDDRFPALQLLDVDGNVLATELLTLDGTPFGTPRLDVTGCPRGLRLESGAIDPATGRIFLSNQGSLTFCNFLWVLTPILPGPTCDPDFNGDGNVDQDDIACLAQVVAGDPACSGFDPDFNGDGNVDQDDIDALAQVVAGAACP